MYSLIAKTGFGLTLKRELAPFALAVLVAQLWFKWGSFALELLGFLIVWYAIGALFKRVGLTSRD